MPTTRVRVRNGVKPSLMIEGLKIYISVKKIDKNKFDLKTPEYFSIKTHNLLISKFKKEGWVLTNDG